MSVNMIILFIISVVTIVANSYFVKQYYNRAKQTDIEKYSFLHT